MRLTIEEIKKCCELVGWKFNTEEVWIEIEGLNYFISPFEHNDSFIMIHYPLLLQLTIEAIEDKGHYSIDIFRNREDISEVLFELFDSEGDIVVTKVGFKSRLEAKEHFLQGHLYHQWHLYNQEESIPEITSELIIELSKSVNKAMEQFNKDVKAVVNKMAKEMGNVK